MDLAEQNILDLSALAPVPVQLKLPDGKTVVVNPPKVAQVLRIGFLGQKLQEGANLNGDELNKLVTDLNAVVVEIIPELAGIELNATQLLSVVNLVADISTPKTVEGIAPIGDQADADPKKP